jgi:hypothetical protein
MARVIEPTGPVGGQEHQFYRAYRANSSQECGTYRAYKACRFRDFRGTGASVDSRFGVF